MEATSGTDPIFHTAYAESNIIIILKTLTSALNERAAYVGILYRKILST
jgi:hypothetical protein